MHALSIQILCNWQQILGCGSAVTDMHELFTPPKLELLARILKMLEPLCLPWYCLYRTLACTYSYTFKLTEKIHARFKPYKKNNPSCSVKYSCGRFTMVGSVLQRSPISTSVSVSTSQWKLMIFIDELTQVTKNLFQLVSVLLECFVFPYTA